MSLPIRAQLFAIVALSIVSSGNSRRAPQNGDYCDFTELKPHPFDCSKYLQCFVNYLYVYSCEEGLLFNPEKLYCDFAHLVRCDDGKKTTAVTSPLSSSTSFPITTPHIGQPCDFNDLRPDPYDCTMFLQCSNNAVIALHCPPSLLFNYQQQSCDYPDNVDCKSLTTPSSTTSVTSTTSTSNTPSSIPTTSEAHPTTPHNGQSCDFDDLRPDPYDCSKFLQCSNKILYIMSCPSSLLFSYKEQICDYAYKVDCDPTTTPGTTTVTSQPTSMTPVRTTPKTTHSSTTQSTTTTRTTPTTTSTSTSETSTTRQTTVTSSTAAPETSTSIVTTVPTSTATTETPTTTKTTAIPTTASTSTPVTTTTPTDVCQSSKPLPIASDPHSYIECQPVDTQCKFKSSVVNCTEGMIYDEEMGGCWYNCTSVTEFEWNNLDRCGSRTLTPTLGYVDAKWEVEGVDYTKDCKYYKTCVLFMENWRPIRNKSGDPEDRKNWQVCQFRCSEGQIFVLEGGTGICVTPSPANTCLYMPPKYSQNSAKIVDFSY